MVNSIISDTLLTVNSAFTITANNEELVVLNVDYDAIATEVTLDEIIAENEFDSFSRNIGIKMSTTIRITDLTELTTPDSNTLNTVFVVVDKSSGTFTTKQLSLGKP
jgi:hypothetical protein